MKKHLAATTALALVLSGGAMVAFAQDGAGVNDTQMTETEFLAAPAEGHLASDLIGETVYSGTGDDAESIGEINDMLVADDGTVPVVIIGVGGFLGAGEKNVAVSFDSLNMATTTDGDRWLVLSTTREALEAAPEYQIAEINTKVVAPDTDEHVEDMAADDMAADDMAADQPAVVPADPNDNIAGDGMAAVEDDAAVNALERDTLQMAPVDTLTATTLINVPVYSSDDINVGEVSDVILTQNGDEGTIDAIVVDVGGFLGIGEKPVAMGFDALEIRADENGRLYAYSSFTKDELDAATAYSADSWDSDRDTMRLSATRG